jgi:S-methylmethionine-dependent homocysteine/selenocysteine methylase
VATGPGFLALDSEIARRASDAFILMDGAVGSELASRGVDMRASLDDTDALDDYWSARALMTDPSAVERLHADYLRAGADIITTNSFRLQPSVTRAMGVTRSSAELASLAASLARRAREAERTPALIAGSIGPVGVWSRPRDAPADAVLHEEHEILATALVAAGVDLLLPETMNSIREARIAAAAAARSGAPFMIGFAITDDSRLHTGEPLEHAAAAVLSAGPLAILVNHSPVRVIGPALERLAVVLAGTSTWYGARAHLLGALGDARMRDGYAAHARRWLDVGARVIGGCCGCGPLHIAGLAELRRSYRTVNPPSQRGASYERSRASGTGWHRQ